MIPASAVPRAVPSGTDPAPIVLDVANLRVRFATERGVAEAVNDVSFNVRAGETLAIVGESGSGKSATALAVMGLIQSANAAVSAGHVRLGGRDLLALGPTAMERIRGRELAMVFQDPMTSLNPVLTIGRQIGEIAELHLGLGPAAARDHAADLLAMVGVPSPRARLGDYPHQFSGGMRQRVMIAMAIACRPSLLIADEPTTALDVTVQAQILELLARLQRESGMAIVFITHDLGVVARVADRMMVMYAGRVVEDGPAEVIFADPQMPYTRGLLRSVPRFDQLADTSLVPIRGNPPDVMRQANHCSFAPRCDSAFDTCLTVVPPLAPCGPDHRSACLLAGRLPPIGADAS